MLSIKELSIDGVKMKNYYKMIIFFMLVPIIGYILTFLLHYIFGCTVSFGGSGAVCRIFGLNLDYLYGELAVLSAYGLMLTIPVGVALLLIGKFIKWLLDSEHNKH